MTRTARFVSLLLAASAGGCSDGPVHAPLSTLGASIAQDPAASRSRYNVFACTTCHAVHAAEAAGRVLPGAPLEGAANRSSYWGGETVFLREAVSRCWVGFMRGTPTDLDGPTGDALSAWLVSLGTDAGTAAATVPATWPRTITDPGPGDAAAGQAVWTRACQSCHGSFGTGARRLGTIVSVLPNDTVQTHCSDTVPAGYADRNAYIRTIAAEKIRHGSFLGYAGTMPPFSVETLSDAQVRDLAAMFRCP